MKRKILIGMPLILLLLSLITSMIAFNYSKQLEDSFLYSNTNPEIPKFSGDYYSILGNIPEDSIYLNIEKQNGEYIVTITDDNDTIIQSVSLNIEENGIINNDVMESFNIQSNLLESPDYALTLSLDNSNSYRFLVEIIENNSNQDEIDIGFFSVESNLIDLQDTFEIISVVSFILGLLSVLVIIKSFTTNKKI